MLSNVELLLRHEVVISLAVLLGYHELLLMDEALILRGKVLLMLKHILKLQKRLHTHYSKVWEGRQSGSGIEGHDSLKLKSRTKDERRSNSPFIGQWEYWTWTLPRLGRKRGYYVASPLEWAAME